MQYRYLIAGLIPDPLRRQIVILQTRWQFTKQILPPHITIVPPFQLAGFRSRAAIMQQVSFQPVLVEYGGFGVFKKPNANVAYLKVTSPSLEQVIQLFRNTLTDLQPVIPKKVSLHITIAKGIPDNDIDRVLLELQSERCKGDFALDKLTLYVGRIDQAGWTVAH